MVKENNAFGKIYACNILFLQELSIKCKKRSKWTPENGFFWTTLKMDLDYATKRFVFDIVMLILIRREWYTMSDLSILGMKKYSLLVLV